MSVQDKLMGFDPLQLVSLVKSEMKANQLRFRDGMFDCLFNFLFNGHLLPLKISEESEQMIAHEP
jgi:hypothetical protein